MSHEIVMAYWAFQDGPRKMESGGGPHDASAEAGPPQGPAGRIRHLQRSDHDAMDADSSRRPIFLEESRRHRRKADILIAPDTRFKSGGT